MHFVFPGPDLCTSARTQQQTTQNKDDNRGRSKQTTTITGATANKRKVAARTTGEGKAHFNALFNWNGLNRRQANIFLLSQNNFFSRTCFYAGECDNNINNSGHYFTLGHNLVSQKQALYSEWPWQHINSEDSPRPLALTTFSLSGGFYCALRALIADFSRGNITVGPGKTTPQ